MRAGGLVVCDAVQLAGRASLDIAALGADFLILSAHKFGGPKGAGALVAARPELHVGAPLLRGGGQERGARAGTENVAAIAGFGAAARVAAAEAGERERAARRACAMLSPSACASGAPDAVIFGETAPRLRQHAVLSPFPASPRRRWSSRSISPASRSPPARPAHRARSRARTCSTRWASRPDLAAGAIRLSLGWASTRGRRRAFRRGVRPDDGEAAPAARGGVTRPRNSSDEDARIRRRAGAAGLAIGGRVG